MKIEDIVKPFFVLITVGHCFGIMFDGKYGYANNHGIQDKKEEVFFNFALAAEYKGKDAIGSWGFITDQQSFCFKKMHLVFPVLKWQTSIMKLM